MCDRERSAAASNDSEIEGAVLGYLERHPQAADTLDGIVHWWLPTQRYQTARDCIECALARLVETGRLHRERLPGGIELYALEPDADAHPRAH